jgi:outer membrane protein assembly factor BamD
MRKFLIIWIAFFLSSCGYQKVLKDGSNEVKYTYAIKYYHKKDYARALPLLESLITEYYGKKEAEEIYYYFAMSHFGGREFLLASYYFKDFHQKFPNSNKREEVSYMIAKCDYHRSMRSELDQTNTQIALSSLQLFIDQHPNSEYVQDANEKIELLRERLLNKVYRNSSLFYKIGEYKAAMVACENAIESYPDMINIDELGYYIVDAAFVLAKNSLQSLQPERYKTVLEKVNYFRKIQHENSSYNKKVTEIEKKTLNELAKLNK